MLVESAWTYRHPPGIGKAKLYRLEVVPPNVREIAWKAQTRLTVFSCPCVGCVSHERSLIASSRPGQTTVLNTVLKILLRTAISSKILILMARPKGFEPLTPRFVVWCSIQLSYGRLPS